MKRIEEYLGKEVDVIIDRPLGSKHPEYDYYYSVNYGFLPNTVNGDNEEIDAYVQFFNGIEYLYKFINCKRMLFWEV